MDTEKLDMETTEDPKPRDINKLVELPYSEMTEEEIELVINFRAESIANDLVHTHNMERIEDATRQQIATNEATAARAMEQLDALTRHAIESYEAASNG